MAKTPKIAPVDAAENDNDASTATTPEAPQRPGTSGTELLLATNRRTASAQYLAAQRAETAYKAKKRSASARTHRNEAKTHFRQSAHHLKEGGRSLGLMVKAVPWMVREWRERRQTEGERKAVERYMEKKRKMEEKIAEQEAREAREKEGAGEAPATA
ncbi:hypothetical protein CC80DRAFT_534436 [Byssothecium circinans]|uniref:Uncharacterized protein n=1 Tax=Byssothecium circinans TaxID=147558 RepID=A0A6A5TZS1_9PLEO|nr:hypothetical protein CC80DRAFT_534436 [Byssothecium circinans]